MPSNTLRIIFLISLFLEYLHSTEEIAGRFPHIDSFMKFGGSIFRTTSEKFYWISHIIYWVGLPIIFLIFQRSSVGLFLAVLFGISYPFEAHHLFKAFLRKSYYPGTITALLYLFIGFFFWAQLLKDLNLLNS